MITQTVNEVINSYNIQFQFKNVFLGTGTEDASGAGAVESPIAAQESDERPMSVAVSEQVMRPDTLLGLIDAHLTHIFLDSETRKTHKYCEVPQDICTILAKPHGMALYREMTQSYGTSFDSVRYKDVLSYTGIGYEFGVFARKRLQKGSKIQGLDGYFAEAVDSAPTFSLFGSEGKPRKERIMLGPASFVNHSCQPNAEYVCGGPTKNRTILRIEAIRNIEENEEIFVSYRINYFGNNNEECACDPCTEKLFRQPIEVPESVSAVVLNSSHVHLTSEVPAASNSSLYANQE